MFLQPIVRTQQEMRIDKIPTGTRTARFNVVEHPELVTLTSYEEGWTRARVRYEGE